MMIPVLLLLDLLGEGHTPVHAEPGGGGRRLEPTPNVYEPLSQAEIDALWPPAPRPRVVVRVVEEQIADVPDAPSLSPAMMAMLLAVLEDD